MTGRVIVGFAALALLVAALLVMGQAPFDDSTFEYQQFKRYEGELVTWPYPMLFTGGTRFLLVGEGKHGVAPLAEGRVGLEGALIRHGVDRMLEVKPGSVQLLGPGAAAAKGQMVDLGPVTLRGEIVDSKCYLGVMNPGRGKVHRDCAARCISGGVPPAFVVREANGQGRVLLLAGRDGRALGREVLGFVAERIVIRGTLVRYGATEVLKAEPRDFTRE